MLAVGRVLLVLLAGIPVCRGIVEDSGTVYSSYYEADGDTENADFYDSYNDELKKPPERTTVVEVHTRLKRNEDVRTLNSGEIIDVKGMLNKVMQGRIPDASREQPAGDDADSYEYPENSNNLALEDRTAIPNAFKKWLPTVEGQRWSPAAGTQGNEVDSSGEGTEQHWSFMYQPETSTYSKDDIVAEVRRMMPEGVIPIRSSIDLQQWKSQQEVQTFGTTENTEETENTNDIGYPQETSTYISSFIQTDTNKLVENWSPETKVIVLFAQEASTYSNSEMQAEVNKLVQHWSPNSKKISTYSNSEMQAEVKKLIQHWSPNSKVLYAQEASTYSNSEMQAEVNKLVQHWSPNSKKTSTYSNSEMEDEVKKLVQHWSLNSKQESTYNDEAMRADVRSLGQHWSTSSAVKSPSPNRIVQHWNPAMSQAANSEIHQEKSGMHSRLGTLGPEEPMSDLNYRIPSEYAQQWNPSDIVHQRDPFNNLQHQLPSHKDLVITPAVKEEEKPDVNIHHWTQTGNAEQWRSLAAEDEDTTLDDDDITDVMRNPTVSIMPGVTVTVPMPSLIAGEATLPVLRGDDLTSPSVGPGQDTTSGVTQSGSGEGDTGKGSSGQSESGTSGSGQGDSETSGSGQGDSGTSDSDKGGSGHTSPGTSGNKTKHTTKHTTKKKTTKRTTIKKTTTKRTTTKRTKRTKKTTTTTTTPPIDIDAIMAIISNLTYDYEWNLTEQFNKSIIQHGVPTCPWKGGKWGPGGAWTATDNGSTLYPWDFENSSVVSKCFVCGLSTPEIPRNAYCADAFAGDFLPLMPIDARSRSMIANYRKYCRYIDVQNYVENPEEPRAIYGRFTGGCAVRWTDITGVYTQRTCRSRYRPLLGKHFASKRMAKLELALVNVDNGCIISPMATLLPVSRGISLYARFHACVCSTNWCNRATLKQTSSDTVLIILVALWLLRSS